MAEVLVQKNLYVDLCTQSMLDGFELVQCSVGTPDRGFGFVTLLNSSVSNIIYSHHCSSVSSEVREAFT
jgi:hypothetical protein